jgi:hypothetical protein
MAKDGYKDAEIKAKMIEDGIEPVTLDGDGRIPFNGEAFVRKHFGVFPSLTKNL